jgi:hypothetical protein
MREQCANSARTCANLGAHERTNPSYKGRFAHPARTLR